MIKAGISLVTLLKGYFVKIHVRMNGPSLVTRGVTAKGKKSEGRNDNSGYKFVSASIS